jgi:hypothetical protein
MGLTAPCPLTTEALREYLEVVVVVPVEAVSNSTETARFAFMVTVLEAALELSLSVPCHAFTREPPLGNALTVITVPRR